MTTFIPKGIAIKVNLLLYRKLNEQNVKYGNSYFYVEHIFWIFIWIASLGQF